ncbi:MAG: dynamin family protein [Pseudomonadota bacterium]
MSDLTPFETGQPVYDDDEDVAETPVSEPSEASDTGPRRPRVAIMGEFSAGKSTLSNLLLGSRALPEKVTATQLPPVWISHGTGDPIRVGTDGGETPISIEELTLTSVDDTRAIRMFHDANLLELCDLVDFPGISDPNMDPEVWERLLPEMDMVLWCTHATQAWRRSEAAVWAQVPEAVRARSCLLITRFDKLTTERDRARVLHRIEAEAGKHFAKVFPISLLQALQAKNGEDTAQTMWRDSGAEAFADHLVESLKGLAAGDTASKTVSNTGETEASAPEAPMFDAAPEPPRRIIPRRIRAGAARRPRPTAE